VTRIVTLTLNPAVDLACLADGVAPTHKTRTFDEHIDPGGGGINVARVLHALGADVLAVVLAGGVTGALIEELLGEAGVPHQTIHCRGRSRISFTVFDRSTRQEYRFVPLGPTAEECDWDHVLTLVNEVECDWLVGSGSLEPGMPRDFYASIAKMAHARGIRFALDTSGAALRLALDGGVDLVKPSLSELEAYCGRALPTAEEQDRAAMALVLAGHASIATVTLAEQGAILATSEQVIRMPAIPVRFEGAVGAGDSFMAGMIWALSRDLSLREALGWAIAAGSAAVARSGTARVRMEDVQEWHAKLPIRKTDLVA
jgi:6-phosphofructokinase 2